MDAEEVKTRLGKVGDYALCLSLFDELYHGDMGSDFKRSFTEYVEEDCGVVVVAEKGDKVVGVLLGSFCLDIDWEGKTGKIDAVFVDEEYRRKGVGSRLLQQFVSIAKKKGAKAVKSRVNDKNFDAQKFHESQGFSRAETFEYFIDFQVTC